MNERDRLERYYLREQKRVYGWAVVIMIVLGLGALGARLLFPH